MCWFLVCLGLAGALGAQTSLHIVAVERKGLPPYERAERIYRVDGGRNRGLRAGDRLLVKRAGEVQVLGRLRVTEVTGDQAEALFEPMDSTYPMKGDIANLEVLKWMPRAGPLNSERLPAVLPPSSTPVAPPQEGVLYFLPRQSELSRAGLNKLESWVEQWGTGGKWVIQMPTAKALDPALQEHRVETLRAALRSLGIPSVTLETEPRTSDGKYDPSWVRHWD